MESLTLIWLLLLSGVKTFENMALHKVAQMSSNYTFDQCLANKAVDGYHSRELIYCTLTAATQTEAWWRVDLGSRKSIVSINFLYGKSGMEKPASQRTRLVGGRHSTQGRVEVYYNSKWGTVCDDGFGASEARVYCLAVGYLPDGAEFTRNFGGGNDPIWLDDVKCCGNEVTRTSCRGSAWGKHNCQHNEDVWISCKQGSTLAGFSIYVSESENWKNGHLCHHDKKTSPPSTNMRITCKTIGRYVTFYNERRYGVTYPDFYSKYAYIQLGELEVYGCRVGLYGSACNQRCSSACLNSVCDAENGHCLDCPSGYEKPTCSTCRRGTYGYQCSQKCSAHCLLGCNNLTGRCSGGCKSGWRGSVCDQACPTGFYGNSCSARCSEHCSNISQCNHVTGYCLGGCAKGWYGNTCNQACPSGFYGSMCITKCSEHCRNIRQCDHVTGHCFGGCAKGWYGNACNKECKSQHYGDGCSYKCGSCKNKTVCRKNDGKCEHGCSPGWISEFCNESCPTGYYGNMCNASCSEHCTNINQCDHVTGFCFGGCADGWYGNTCDKAPVLFSTAEPSQGNTALALAIIFGIGNAVFISLLCVLWFRIKGNVHCRKPGSGSNVNKNIDNVIFENQGVNNESAVGVSPRETYEQLSLQTMEQHLYENTVIHN